MIANFLIFFLTISISIIYIYNIYKKRLEVFNNINNKDATERFSERHSISVIIPARNEESNIGKILSCLQVQSVKPDEIIVVDDNSSDRTSEVASKFSGVKVLKLNEEPPNGWAGKPWAVWNGVKISKGDLLVFFDADLEPGVFALETLIKLYEKYGGLISVWPYQRFEKFYEHFTAVFNILVVCAGNMIGFPFREPSGAFGPAILTSRKDYECTGGHETIKDSVLEDIKLGKLYLQKGIKVNNFLGNGIVKFRMYPSGFKQLFDGFAKNMSSGASTGGLLSFTISLVWISGYFSSFSNFTLSASYIFFRYFVLAFMFYLLLKPTGDYKWYDALFYPFHFMFFIIVFLYSLYQTLIIKKVIWKGRKLSV